MTESEWARRAGRPAGAAAAEAGAVGAAGTAERDAVAGGAAGGADAAEAAGGGAAGGADGGAAGAARAAGGAAGGGAAAAGAGACDGLAAGAGGRPGNAGADDDADDDADGDAADGAGDGAGGGACRPPRPGGDAGAGGGDSTIVASFSARGTLGSPPPRGLRGSDADGDGGSDTDDDGVVPARRGCGPGQSQIDRLDSDCACDAPAADGVANAGVRPGDGRNDPLVVGSSGGELAGVEGAAASLPCAYAFSGTPLAMSVLTSPSSPPAGASAGFPSWPRWKSREKIPISSFACDPVSRTQRPDTLSESRAPADVFLRRQCLRARTLTRASLHRHCIVTASGVGAAAREICCTPGLRQLPA